jgi:hypothetical protein
VISRGRRSSGRFLIPKLGLFFTGAAVFLAGVLLKRDDVVPFAIPLLLAGIALRFFEREQEEEEPEPEEPEEDEREDDEGAAT